MDLKIILSAFRRVVTLKVDQVLIDFFQEHTKELPEESQKILQEYKLSRMYFEILYTKISIGHLEKEPNDLPIGFMSISFGYDVS